MVSATDSGIKWRMVSLLFYMKVSRREKKLSEVILGTASDKFQVDPKIYTSDSKKEPTGERKNMKWSA